MGGSDGRQCFGTLYMYLITVNGKLEQFYSLTVSFVPSALDGQFLLSGLPRLHLDSYASQIRVKMNVSQSIPEKFHWKIEVCFHS
jgi:hypothetical protein